MALFEKLIHIKLQAIFTEVEHKVDINNLNPNLTALCSYICHFACQKINKE